VRASPSGARHLRLAHGRSKIIKSVEPRIKIKKKKKAAAMKADNG